MTEQEQEHWDHEAGSASELQNCLSEARMSLSQLNHKASKLIADALAENLFVVVVESTHYCRSTDAIAGVRKSYYMGCILRSDAEMTAQQIVNDSQGEDNAYVLPRLPDPAPDKAQLAAMWAARPVDDCPF
jgi:hypothetical protein